MRIGFLFNHAAAHQVAHSLPIAGAIARIYPEAGLELLVAEGPAEEEVRRLWAAMGHPADDHRIRRLAPASPIMRLVARVTGNAIPSDRVSVLARNLEHFRNLDALVVPEKTSTLLRARFGLEKPALIHTRHGAGDRAIGFDTASARFDLVLVSGDKIRDRLADAGLLKPGGHAVVGYPKFDLPGGKPDVPLFDNAKPTVLYNPHPSPALSSWYGLGPAVLEWFAAQERFNLIFAPHVSLFIKRWTIGLSPFSVARVPPVPEAASGHPQIHIDKGSRASVDMTYTAAADIYLGDASSQVYEFLMRPRPCVFLDPHGRQWQGDPNFAHWGAGAVVSSIDAMAAALDEALARPHRYDDVQRELFSYSFDLREQPSADRAAEAIMTWLRTNKATQ